MSASATGSATPAAPAATGKGLTSEQLLAAAATEPAVFIEAAPGSGKTTVAAERYGFLHYSALADPRAIVAVSFTRAATWELRRRIVRTWGLGALRPPNRVVTIDTLLLELLHHLLRRGELTWPQGHADLRVLDKWSTAHPHTRTTTKQTLTVRDRTIVRTRVKDSLEVRITGPAYWENILAGTCTHDDVRAVVAAALSDRHLAAFLGGYLAATLRGLLIDEVFDANQLDLDLISLARHHGVTVTLIGDPWQALYEFRGARTHLINGFVTAQGLRTYRLTRSFRFRSPHCVALTRDLRDRKPVAVPPRDGAALDVVLAHEWKTLWAAGGDVLPMSFNSPNTVERAAATLLADLVTSAAFGQHAVFAEESYRLLGITDPAARDRLRPHLIGVLDILRSPAATAVNDTWDALVTAIGTESTRHFRPRHHAYTEPLRWLRAFLHRDVSHPVPGLTVHQAKGREWEAVGVCLTGTEKAALASGLDPLNSNHRILYVALTRAKSTIVAL
ncbi:UvrD-helicase domain-containing protein [Micromonospora globbae]|uniref:UvrD-helicase domain-containing protein n=1 Tax=Micromonospora globbae TaxID=1894969 RepID=UPI00343ABD77